MSIVLNTYFTNHLISKPFKWRKLLIYLYLFILVTHWPNSDISRCQFAVAGVYDGTQVVIELPSLTNGVIDVELDGQTYSNGDTITVAMNRYSTLQIQSRGIVFLFTPCAIGAMPCDDIAAIFEGDLSGTRVISTQKVAVFSGNIRTAVGGGSSRDHLVAMLPPVDSWGKLYSWVPIPGNTKHYQCTASQISIDRSYISVDR